MQLLPLDEPPINKLILDIIFVMSKLLTTNWSISGPEKKHRTLYLFHCIDNGPSFASYIKNMVHCRIFLVWRVIAVFISYIGIIRPICVKVGVSGLVLILLGPCQGPRHEGEYWFNLAVVFYYKDVLYVTLLFDVALKERSNALKSWQGWIDLIAGWFISSQVIPCSNPLQRKIQAGIDKYSQIW